MLGFASTGFSQPAITTTNPTYELSAGYQFLHVPDQSFPFGFAIDGARHYGRFGLAADIGWSQHSDDELGTDLSTNMFHFAAGPRWTGFGSRQVWPYAQVLVGAAVARTSLEIAGVDSGDTDGRRIHDPARRRRHTGDRRPLGRVWTVRLPANFVR